MSFKYVLVPCDSTQPVAVKRASKAGGLQNDELVKQAKEYFEARKAPAASGIVEKIDKASPEERKAIANEIRKQNPGSDALDDDSLIRAFQTANSPSSSCEIHALVIPTPTNGHVGVSAYSASDAGSLQNNERAVALMRACGHAAKDDAIRGDAFFGRYVDDEKADVWERTDLSPEETSPDADWCARARRAGGGGGTGGAAPSSSDPTGKGAGTDEKVKRLYEWSQTDEEVELSFLVDEATAVKVNFARSSLKVSVAGRTIAEGETGGDVAVDDSTYTIQDGKDGKKEVTVTLAKKNEGLKWNYAVLDK